MCPRTKIYFASDVHLGSMHGDPADREARFVSWLRSLPREETLAVYLLGDIWDFWYEYRDVIPREGARVVAALIDLLDAGVEVWFVPGNHDIWCYSFFESLGMRKCEQPLHVELGGRRFCLGHGDGLGPVSWSYRLVRAIFHCRPLQILFSTLHPWIAYRIGSGWSGSSRRAHGEYHFRGAGEPVGKWADDVARSMQVDHFIFGHYHRCVDMTLPSGARLTILGDWMANSAPHGEYDIETQEFVIR